MSAPCTKNWQPLLDWAVSRGAGGLLERYNTLEFKLASASSGLGCFALKNFQVGDILFSIPVPCIFGLNWAVQMPIIRSLLTIIEIFDVGNESKLTSELILWLAMCWELKFGKQYEPYLKSLDSDNLAIPSTWPEEVISYLEGTNLLANIATSSRELNNQQHFLNVLKQKIALDRDDLLSTDHLDSSSDGVTDMLSSVAVDDVMKFLQLVTEEEPGLLLWAKSHYLSRRYPGRFTENADTAAGRIRWGSLEISNDPSFGNIGSLVPILDILNHDSSQDWLRLQLNRDNDRLDIICNHPVKKGEELFSNYGALSNEKLLFAYGFAQKDNENDEVAVQLAVQPSAAASVVACSSDPPAAGIFHISHGGLEGIPEELWNALTNMIGISEEDNEDGGTKKEVEDTEGTVIGAEECEILLEHLEKKYEKFLQSEEKSEFYYDPEIATDVKVNGKRKGSKRRKLDRTAISIFACFASAKDVRVQFIGHYREGQKRILEETISDLRSTLDSLEQ